MVFRTTATRNTQIRWLTREGLLEELDLLIFACRRKPEAKAKVARLRGKRWHPELDNLCAAIDKLHKALQKLKD